MLARACAGYNGVVAGNEITRGLLGACPEKTVEAGKAALQIAREAAELVRALYAVERQGKELPAIERLQLSPSEVRPGVGRL